MTLDHTVSQETQTKGDAQPSGRSPAAKALEIAIDRNGPYPSLIPSRSDWWVRLSIAPDPWHGSQNSCTRQIIDRAKGSEIGKGPKHLKKGGQKINSRRRF